MRHGLLQQRLAIAAIGLCAVGGCGRSPQGDTEPLVVLVSGDTAGWIVPCGCASNQSGGLPRRANYAEKASSGSAVILADAGGAGGGVSPYDRAKLEAILRGEAAMGVAAHNIGRSEAALGAESLGQLAATIPVPFVSANTRDADGQPLADALRIVEAAGRRIALVGVLSPTYAEGGIQVLPPREAVLDALASVEGRYDAAVVLAYLPPDELRELAETLPEVDAVVGGPTGQPLPPEQLGPVLLTSATNKGKFLVRLDASDQATKGYFGGSIVELDDEMADEPTQLANLQRFYGKLREANFRPAETTFASPSAVVVAGFRVAGNESCRECHEEDCQLWDESKHAVAWESLAEKGAEVDPDCQRCHTTGYGRPGGFESVRRSPSRVDVGCESCHGPSAAHVADAKVHTPLKGRAKDGCIECHDRENSPQFDYDRYWLQIQHGTKSKDEG